LDESTVAEMRRRYDTDPNPESRRRYQMVWLAHLGQRVTQIAQAVLRSEDTVTRVLRRFLDGGLDAVPRHIAPGAAPTITPEWPAELLRSCIVHQVV
jgi:transposase